MSGQQAAVKHERRIDYVEFASRDPAASRRFFEEVFGWSFEDYGPDYTAFDDGGLQGGFFRGEPATSAAGAPLVVLHATRLAPLQAAVHADTRLAVISPNSPSPVAAVSSSSSPAATSWRYGPSATRIEQAPAGGFLPRSRPAT